MSEERELLYIRVPKTGSESFVSALNLKWVGRVAYTDRFARGVGRSEGHQTAWDAIRSNPMYPRYRHYKKIGFVRHPLPWLNSFFGWCMRGYQWRDYINGPAYERDGGGDQFLFNLTVTPLSWLTHPTTGELLVDEVLRTEDMSKIAGDMSVVIKNINPTTPGRFKKELDWHDYRLRFIKQRFVRELEYYDNGI